MREAKETMQPASGSTWRTVGWILVGLIGFFGIQQSMKRPTEPEKERTPIRTYLSGETVLLGQTGDRTVIPAAESVDAMHALMEAEEANNRDRILMLRRTKRVAPIAGGTPATVLKKEGVGAYWVQITDGPYAGASRLVITEHLHPRN